MTTFQFVLASLGIFMMTMSAFVAVAVEAGNAMQKRQLRVKEIAMSNEEYIEMLTKSAEKTNSRLLGEIAIRDAAREPVVEVPQCHPKTLCGPPQVWAGEKPKEER